MKRILIAAALHLIPITVMHAPAAMASAALAPEVSLDELKAAVKGKSATIIDANGDDMYKKGHIPGAVHFAKHKDNLAAVLPKDKNAEVIAYCGGPLCTAWEDAAKAAKGLGYTNIKHYKGGIKGWKEAKLDVEKS